MDNYAIELLHITKVFPGIVANDDITLRVRYGEIHALLGENGAGKSTLMSVLFGLYQPEEGEILVNGKKAEIKNPRTANALGIGMVHQHFMLVQNFTVLENIVLGVETAKHGVLQMEEARKKVLALSERYGLNIDCDARVSDITVGMQQRTEILKMLYRDNEILIFDEPTTGLDPQTRRLLWDVVTELRRKEKLTVFLTTHYMEEAADADYVILLDSGRVVGEGTPLALKNTYAGDHITLYGVEEAAVRALGRKYAPVQGGWRIEVENTGEATKLILAQPALFTDYEITKGNMDDVFLAATGKKLHGGAEV